MYADKMEDPGKHRFHELEHESKTRLLNSDTLLLTGEGYSYEAPYQGTPPKGVAKGKRENNPIRKQMCYTSILEIGLFGSVGPVWP